MKIFTDSNNFPGWQFRRLWPKGTDSVPKASEYSLDNVNWTPCGETLDGKLLSTKAAGGFVGAYLGLYAYADTSAKATFDWATYKKIVK